MKRSSPRKIPKITTDAQAENLLNHDLSDFINVSLRETSFEFAPKDKVISLRLNSKLLKALKDEAKRRGVDYHKLIRLALEKIVKASA